MNPSLQELFFFFLDKLLTFLFLSLTETLSIILTPLQTVLDKQNESFHAFCHSGDSHRSVLATIKNRLTKHLFTRVRQTGRASDNRGARGRCCDTTQQSRHNKTARLFFSQMESVVSDPQIVPLLPTGGRTRHRSEEDSGRKNMGKGIERINNHKSYESILCKFYGGFAFFLKHESRIFIFGTLGKLF